jgi:hypothetical protein
MAGFNIANFTSHINANGIMRNNKFLVRMSYPIGIDGKSDLTNTSRYIELWCDSANLPGVSMQTTQFRRYGYGVAEKRPVAPSFNNVSMTFMGDSKGSIHSYFHNWMKLINNYNLSDGNLNNYKDYGGHRSYELAYKDDYAVDIRISVFKENTEEVIKIVLRQAFPTDIGDIQLNWNDTNDYMRIPVSFTYTDWYTE